MLKEWKVVTSAALQAIIEDFCRLCIFIDGQLVLNLQIRELISSFLICVKICDYRSLWSALLARITPIGLAKLIYIFCRLVAFWWAHQAAALRRWVMARLIATLIRVVSVLCFIINFEGHQVLSTDETSWLWCPWCGQRVVLLLCSDNLDAELIAIVLWTVRNQHVFVRLSMLAVFRCLILLKANKIWHAYHFASFTIVFPSVMRDLLVRILKIDQILDISSISVSDWWFIGSQQF